MSYTVLARKWRPRDFSQVVGQEHVVRALVNALDNDRLHHAFLFSGTRGVGKTTLARILAKALNCETGVTSVPCGKCAACVEIDEGRFVDLIEVDAASRTKVDDTRELLDNVQYTPTRGRYKVYLIDEVHMLSRHSFNALLKTLEEPPPHVKFLLATTDPQKLPVTVLSRCLQFNLKRLPVTLIARRLADITQAENIEAEPAGLNQLARAADGSMRDGLSLLDQTIAFGGGRVHESEVQEMLGTIDKKYTLRLLDALARHDGAALLAEVAAMEEHSPDYAGVLDSMAALLQRAAVARLVPDAVDDSHEDFEAISQVAQAIGDEDIQLFYQIAITGRRDLQLAPDARGGFEMVLLRMLAFRPAASNGGETPPAAAKSPPTQRQRPGPGPAPSATSTAGSPAPEPRAASSKPKPAAAPIDPAQAKAFWDNPDWEALQGQLPVQGAARQLAAHCALEKRDGKVVHLSLDKRFDTLLTQQLHQRLTDAFCSWFGEDLRLDIQVGVPATETPAQRSERNADARLEQARQSIEQDPNIRALKDTFEATVDTDSIRA
ncbi:MAG: DNA polymerase III subunit gamma/tau, partial [Pseudomonadota bacterium]